MPDSRRGFGEGSVCKKAEIARDYHSIKYPLRSARLQIYPQKMPGCRDQWRTTAALAVQHSSRHWGWQVSAPSEAGGDVF
jgi:hypothetical protein